MPGRAFRVAARAVMKTAMASWWTITIAATGQEKRVRAADIQRFEARDMGANQVIVSQPVLVLEKARVPGLAVYDRIVDPEGTVWEIKNILDNGGGHITVDLNLAPARPNPQAGPLPA